MQKAIRPAIRWVGSVGEPAFDCKHQRPGTRAGERVVVGEDGVPFVKWVKRVCASGFNVAHHRVGQLQPHQCLVGEAVVDTSVQVAGQDCVGQVSVLAAVVERQGWIVRRSIARRILQDPARCRRSNNQEPRVCYGGGH